MIAQSNIGSGKTVFSKEPDHLCKLLCAKVLLLQLFAPVLIVTLLKAEVQLFLLKVLALLFALPVDFRHLELEIFAFSVITEV